VRRIVTAVLAVNIRDSLSALTLGCYAGIVGVPASLAVSRIRELEAMRGKHRQALHQSNAAKDCDDFVPGPLVVKM
jgi:hypothetical protein